MVVCVSSYFSSVVTEHTFKEDDTGLIRLVDPSPVIIAPFGITNH